MNISPGETLIIHMLADVYRQLNIPKDKGLDPEFITDALSHGYSWAIPMRYHGLDLRMDTPPEAKEVMDVLDMWRVLEARYSQLTPADQQAVLTATGKTKVEISGFDGHEDQLGIASFLVDSMGLWNEFSGRINDSHSPRRDQYARMLVAFNKVRRDSIMLDLTAEQIITVLQAERYPREP